MSKTCCGKEFKTPAGYKGHLRMSKNHAEGAVEAAPAKVVETGEVTFQSPKYPFLRIVVHPEDYDIVEISPGRSKLRPVPGKRVEFDNGVFKTNDPEVIAFIKDRYRSSNPETARTPVTWVGKEW